jgi:hypothetical protein
VGCLGSKETNQNSKSCGKYGDSQTVDNGTLIREFSERRYVVFKCKKNITVSFRFETAQDHHDQRKYFIKKNDYEKR